MRIELSLYRRILAGIILLAAVIISFSYYLNRQILHKDQLTRLIDEDIQPSITLLSNLEEKYQDTRIILLFWADAGASDNLDYRGRMETVFTEEINQILDQLAVLSVKWNPEDLELFRSTQSMIRDSLYYSYLDLMRDFRLSVEQGEGYTDIEEYIEQQPILFLLSEVEQNLSYLVDKRKSEMQMNFTLIEESALHIRKTVSGFAITILLLIISISILAFFFIRNSVSRLNHGLTHLTQGIIPQDIKVVRKDEIGELYNQLNKLFAYLRSLTLVARKINQKEFDSRFRPLSDKDELGIALLDLQNNLKQSIEEEMRRKKEDNERSWTAEGVARINDLLRLSGDRLDELGYILIREIVNYTGSQVGALYILNENPGAETEIEMIAAYAYDRQKFLRKTLHIGEGLVGRCVQENETIHLTDVPENYLTVKSGLGDSKPSSILIVPLHLNENVYGVIELASFSIYEPYKIAYLDIIGENIATSVSKVKINLQTKHLLEQTRQQAEEMTAQEEEMRQNMEELRSTQEMSAIREEKLRKEIEAMRMKAGES